MDGVGVMEDRPNRHVEFEWTSEKDALLGTVKDRDLAAKLGCSRALVSGRRHLLGISRFNQEISKATKCEWTPAMDGLLGTMSDKETAEKLGLSITTIRTRRVVLGIPIKQAPRIVHNKFNWTPEIEAQLGTMGDRQLAEHLGVSRTHVTNRRKVLGIAPKDEAVTSSLKFEWTPEMDALLGSTLDKVIAKQLGLSTTSVSKRRNILNIAPYVHPTRWSQDQDALLGTAPDTELAAQWGYQILSSDHAEPKRTSPRMNSQGGGLPN